MGSDRGRKDVAAGRPHSSAVRRDGQIGIQAEAHRDHGPVDYGRCDRGHHDDRHRRNGAMIIRFRDSQRASVLIVVLWATFGLVAVALLFGHSMLMTYR